MKGYYGPKYPENLPVSPINTAWIVKDYYDSIAGYITYFYQAADNMHNSSEAVLVKAIADAFNETFISSFSATHQVR